MTTTTIAALDAEIAKYQERIATLQGQMKALQAARSVLAANLETVVGTLPQKNEPYLVGGRKAEQHWSIPAIETIKAYKQPFRKTQLIKDLAARGVVIDSGSVGTWLSRMSRKQPPMIKLLAGNYWEYNE